VDEREITERGLSRRGFLAASGMVVLAGARGAPRPEHRRAPFAVVADSHLDPHSPGHTANMQAVFDHMLARPERPAFVLHVGDVVEAGLPGEYEEWDAIRPAALDGDIHAVPGNHEIRWDEWAGERYFERFEQTPYAFDAAGVHVVALDPTQLLQEPGYFHPDQLEWLERDLRRVRRDTPTVLFVHYPMGRDYHYIGNQDALWEAIEHHDVHAIIAGHVHREEVTHQNGVPVVTLPGVLNVAAYDWVAPGTDDRGRPTLAITRSQLTAGTWADTPVIEVPLTSERRRRRPSVRFSPTPDRSAGDVRVDLPHDLDAATVRARVWPEHTWGQRNDAGWFALTARSSRRWEGTLPTADLAAGRYRLHVRVSDSDGALCDAIPRVELPTLPADRLRLAWAVQLGASIQAPPAPLPGGRVVAATVHGRVSALALESGRARERWRFDAGGAVLGRPLVDPDAQLVVVGAANHRIHALDAGNGRHRWTFRTTGPALGSPERTDGGAVLAPAGRTLHALDPRSGEALWSADVGGFVAGLPAADERAAYVGAGDGKAHAFDLATGARLWTRTISSRENPYRTLIYGPWTTKALLLPGDRVLITTVTSAQALDRATGTPAWSVAGGFLFSTALLLPDRLILAGEQGEVLAVDPGTGVVLWRVRLTQRVIGGAAALFGDAVAIAGVNGLVALLDPATGADRGRLHPSVDYVYGTPAAVGDVLVTGSQDGWLRGIAIRS
jgi:outer membrane protein assembly factor BamB/predicted phosphodiesterase